MVEVRRRRSTEETIHRRLGTDGKHKVTNYQAETETHPTRTKTCVYENGSQNQWGGNGGQNEAGVSRGDDGKY
jgi:hypothetical protein